MKADSTGHKINLNDIKQKVGVFSESPFSCLPCSHNSHKFNRDCLLRSCAVHDLVYKMMNIGGTRFRMIQN